MEDEREYVIATIGAYLNGSISEWDWELFSTRPLASARLDAIRRRASVVRVPLDMEGEARMRDLLDAAERLSEEDPRKTRPWRMETGLLCGLIVGAVAWWFGSVQGGGLFQKLHLVLVPAALGVLIVVLRNKREKAGIHDPETMEQNKRGRI